MTNAVARTAPTPAPRTRHSCRLEVPQQPASAAWRAEGKSATPVAWGSFLAGAALRFWATLYVGGRKERELVTDGPYSICRHPLYVGSLLLGVSAGLFLESPLFLTALLLVVMLYMHATVPVEEAVLRAKHAQQYDAYARRVPRYWPSFRAFHAPGHISVDVHTLWLECARASRWMLLPILGETLTYLRTLAWWPRMFRFF
jgi:hypothetical protein